MDFTLEQLPSKLLTWCSSDSNTISVFDLGTKQKYAKFIGVNLKNKDGIPFFVNVFHEIFRRV